MFDDDTLQRLRRAAMARYALLPGGVLVTPKTGTPVGAFEMTDGSYLVTAASPGLGDHELVVRYDGDLVYVPVYAAPVAVAVTPASKPSRETSGWSVSLPTAALPVS